MASSSLPYIGFLKLDKVSQAQNGNASSAELLRKVDAIYKMYPSLELGADAITSHEVPSSMSHMHDLFEAVKALIQLYLDSENYSAASRTIQQFASQVNFFTQPNTIKDFSDNKYLEFLFYQYAVYIQSIRFDRGGMKVGIESSDPTKQPVNDQSKKGGESGLSRIFAARSRDQSVRDVLPSMNAPDKYNPYNPHTNSNISGSRNSVEFPISSFDTTDKKAKIYFNKTKMILFGKGQQTASGKSTSSSSTNMGVAGSSSNSPASELNYYYLICLLRLTELFRKGQYFEFYSEFIELIETEPIHGISPLGIILDPQCRHTLKKNLVVMLGVSSALTLPFKDLSFLNSRESEKTRNTIIDIFTLTDEEEGDDIWDNYNLPLQLYQFLVYLSETKFKEAKSITRDHHFKESFTSQLGQTINFAAEKSRSINFLEFFIQTIESKIFLMVISHVKRIPRIKLLQTLGYDSDPMNRAMEGLLSLMASLNLGESGIGYDIMGDFFFNNGPQARLSTLKTQVDNLGIGLEGDSLAEIVYAALSERLLSE